jgi:hypothetical protein
MRLSRSLKFDFIVCKLHFFLRECSFVQIVRVEIIFFRHLLTLLDGKVILMSVVGTNSDPSDAIQCIISFNFPSASPVYAMYP